jgi:hypothetical protein
VAGGRMRKWAGTSRQYQRELNINVTKRKLIVRTTQEYYKEIKINSYTCNIIRNLSGVA